MRILFYLMPAVVFIPVGIYLYHFMKRLLSLFRIKRSKRADKIISVVFAVACAAAGWRVYDVGSVAVLYFVGCSLLLDGVHRFLKRYLKENRGVRIWNVIHKSGIIPLLVVSVLFTYGYVNIHQVRETAYTLHSDKISGEGLRIAQISDLHMGTTMGVEELRGYCEKIQAKDPDIVFLTGDIFDERTEKSMMEAAAAVLGNIDAEYGVYYVWGNHDPNHYSAQAQYNMEELRLVLNDSQIRVLEDEAVQVTQELAVIGRMEQSLDRNRKSVKELAADLEPGSYQIVLDHRPVELEENAAAGVDLQLSGHTHAGQIWPTGQLAELLGINEMNYGLKNIEGFHAIVSSGIAGWGYAVRTGGHSEYVLIDVEP
ncbi:MAG: metallophosphoesterase [Eubacterium sp.]|nr:metallophosphoesterase [Eubacterium sp.]